MGPKSGKNNLSIRLTESVVFLRGSVDTVVTGRRTSRDAQPAMLRGLLILSLTKPMKISSIEITLEGKSQTAWPEGVGARKLEITEEHEIFSATTVYFRAGKTHHQARRTASVGPGLILDHDDDDDSSLTDDAPHHDRQQPPGSSHSSIRPDTLNNTRRRVSMDYHHLRRNDSGFASWGLQDIPSPPYSPLLPPISHTLSNSIAAQSQGGHGHERAQSVSLSSPNSAPVPQRPALRSRRESWGSTATGGSGSASSNLSIHRQESRITMRSSLDSPGYHYIRDGPSMHTRSSSASVQSPNIPDLSLSRRVSQEDDEHIRDSFPVPSISERSQSRGRPRLQMALDMLTGNTSGSRSGSNSRAPSILRNSSRPSTRPASPVTPYGHLAPPPPTPSSTSQIHFSSPGHSPFESLSHVGNGPEAFARPGYERSPSNPEASPARGRDRRHTRFSLAAVSNVLLDAVKERVRSSSRSSRPRGTGSTPVVSREPSPEGGPSRRNISVSVDRETERGRSRGRDNQPEKEKERSTLGKISGALGLDNDDDENKKEHGHGWKEFKKGTYTYPISFAIPANSPPTLSCDFGSVSYRLKATVHRPGAFTQRLTAAREVMLIACPGEDDLDESDNIVVQREWDAQMHYMIVISGRAFPIGSTIPLQLTFMPISKIKIFRISAVLEERVDYYTQFKRVARTDTLKKFELLSIRHTDKEPVPILPLTSDYSISPLRGYVDAPDDSEAASSLMGPGPWVVQHELQLPKSCARMHFTNKHKRSNIGITHTLKIIFRVERGDDLFVDSKTGRRKHFDIVVQTPIHVLSCRCNPEWTSLPRYTSFATEHYAKTQTCPCSQKQRGSTVSVDDLHDPPLLPPTHPVHPVPGPSGSALLPPSFAPMETHAEDEPPESVHRTDRQAIPAGGLYLDGHTLGLDLSRTQSDVPSETESIYRRNTQFARLVAGEESEIGEAPPTYDSIVCMQNAVGALATTTVVPAHR